MTMKELLELIRSSECFEILKQRANKIVIEMEEKEIEKTSKEVNK